MIIEGPIITLLAAFLASLGLINVISVYLLSVLGNAIGDICYYTIGRYGRERFIERYGRYIGLDKEKIVYIEEHYKQHLLKTIAIAKATEAPVVPTLVAAGISRVSIKKFILASVAIEIPKMLVIVVVGYYFGRFYVTIEQYFKDFVFAGILTLALFVLLFVTYKMFKKRI